MCASEVLEAESRFRYGVQMSNKTMSVSRAPVCYMFVGILHRVIVHDGMHLLVAVVCGGV